MKDVSSLVKKLKAYLPLHQARITFIAQFVTALLRSRSTNLYQVAEEFQDSESSYRRIKRFFTDYDYSFEQLGGLILSCWTWIALPYAWIEPTGSMAPKTSTIWWYQLLGKEPQSLLFGSVLTKKEETPIQMNA